MKRIYKYRWPLAAIFFVLLSGNIAWALGFKLSESKDELKLDYKLNVKDIGTGGYLIDLTINDAGRMNPIYAIDLYIPRKEGKEADGSIRPDLALSLATRKVGKTQKVHFQLRKDWAKRAVLQLKTSGLDGKIEPLSWYYFEIPIADAIGEKDSPNIP